MTGDGVALGSVRHVREDPHAFAQWVSGPGVVYGLHAFVVWCGKRLIVFHLDFDRPPAPELADFPTEAVRLSVFADGHALAVPVGGDSRSWCHRYPHPSIAELSRGLIPQRRESLFGALCLWDPRDPRHLRWGWEDGLDAFIRMVQRHLWYEEYWRRTGDWPVEDTPHGERADGLPHPIRDPRLRAA